MSTNLFDIARERREEASALRQREEAARRKMKQAKAANVSAKRERKLVNA